jgi:hypothetical protein
MRVSVYLWHVSLPHDINTTLQAEVRVAHTLVKEIFGEPVPWPSLQDLS